MGVVGLSDVVRGGDSSSQTNLSGASIPVSMAAQWHVLHTKSRQEKILCADLQAMNIAHYLPLVKCVRYYGKRKANIEMPLFPGYVFLMGSLDEAYQADRTKRI